MSNLKGWLIMGILCAGGLSLLVYMCVIILGAIQDMKRKQEEWKGKMNCEMREWIPVTERVPYDDMEVLAWCDAGFSYVDCWKDGEWQINRLVDGKYTHVTYWMPLPESPNVERKVENV